MVPIDVRHAPSPKKPRHDAGEAAWRLYREQIRETALPKVAAERVVSLREELAQEGPGDRPIWTVVDGGYTNGTFIKGVGSACAVVGRIRADAKLYHLPESSLGKVGRNRVYGTRAPTPNELREDSSIPWKEVSVNVSGKSRAMRIKTLGPLRWRPTGKAHDFKLLVIAPLRYRISAKGKHMYRQPAYLICNDPSADPQEILQRYVRRWDIEVNFRDQKTLLGVGQAQVRKPDAVEKVPALAIAAYSALLASSIQAFGVQGIPQQLPRPKWNKKQPRRATTTQLLNLLRHEVWADSIRFSSFESSYQRNSKPEKSIPRLHTALFYASG